MNYIFLGKLGSLLLCGGGFGFTSWLFWPEPQAIPEYLYLYTKSETLSSNNSDVVLNKTINKNFECKIKDKNIDCDILEPESTISHTYKKTSVIQAPRFKTNPEKLNKEELKKANNVYVLKINKKHENIIKQFNSSDTIEVVSTKEKDKKYATLKLNVVLDEKGGIFGGMPNNAIENKTIGILQTHLMSTTQDEITKQKTQEQMMNIISDSNKMTIANKIFENCSDNTQQPKSFGCANVEKSLDMLSNNLNNKPDGTPNDLTSALLSRNGKQISDFFAIIDTQGKTTTPTISKPNNATNVLLNRNSDQLTTFFSIVDAIEQKSSTSTSTTQNKPAQLFNILADSNKLNIANKVFGDCKSDATQQSFACKDVDKSLDMMSKRLKDGTEDSPSNLTRALSQQTGKQITAFFTVVETTETIKEQLKPENILNSLFGFFNSEKNK